MISLWDSLVKKVAQTGIHPNAITVFGSLFQCFIGILFWQGHLAIGGFLLIIASLFDLLDGAVAKQSGKMTRFGAFLDSTLDRLSDMALYGGMIGYFSRQGESFYAVLAFYCLVTGILISYSKARSENLIPDCTVGLAQRPERLGLLIAATLFGSVHLGFWIIAIISTLTAVQRIRHTYRTIHHLQLPPWESILFLDFGRWSVGYRVIVISTLGIIILHGLLR